MDWLGVRGLDDAIGKFVAVKITIGAKPDNERFTERRKKYRS
jgi:hypothetical protein